MVEISTEFDVECDECGASLDATFEAAWSRSKSSKLTIKPCERCVDDAYKQGEEDAKDGAP